jgi:cytochrome c
MMSSVRTYAGCALALLSGCGGGKRTHAQLEPFGVGRPATAAEIARVDDDVRPDGRGLPAGRGTVPEGAAIYASQCAGCHGATGREGPYDVLVGAGEPMGWRVGRRPPSATPPTIGNLWPYATTLFDYIHRAMPWEHPGSLSSDDTYAIVAWLLHENGLLPFDAQLDARSLPKVKMPARRRFLIEQ